MNTKVNSLDVKVTRPDQKLVIMRGIPGGGKSTKAKEIVEGGVIHSTDNVIESMGDYKEFFAKMIEAKDFSELHKAHTTNLKNAKESMKNGISPVIIDNTNIKANEPKAVVEAALKMGFADENISIVDIGTGGLDAEALAARNTHGVPLDKIEAMIQSHKSVGELTLKKILEAKDMFTASPILYSAVVLDAASRNMLLDMIAYQIPAGWKPIAHHMTIKTGPLKDKAEIGKKVQLFLTHLGISDKAMAVRVQGYESANAIPHVTIAVNPEGGLPKMSNDITNWRQLRHTFLTGVVTEVSRYVKKEDEPKSE